VVNTHGVAPDDIEACVVACVEKWRAREEFYHYWVSPAALDDALHVPLNKNYSDDAALIPVQSK
jgi:hypothetical protein